MRTISLSATVKAVTIGAAIGCALVLAAMAGAYFLLERAQTGVGFANSLNTEVSRLNILTTELFVHDSRRARLQWTRHYNSLTRQLAAAPHFQNRADVLLDEIEKRAQALRHIVDRINSPRRSEQSAETRSTIFSAAIGQSSAIVSDTTELHDMMASSAAQMRMNVLLGLGAASLAVMFGGGFVPLLLSTGMLSHILKLRRVIRRIARGDLEAAIPQDVRNEIGDVFRELDGMRRNLLETMSELGRANLELISIKAKLEDRTAGLEAANRELETFASAVSHDLRAPLRTISGFSQAVLDDHAGQLDEDGKTMLGRIHRATRQMHELIEDLLKLSKLGQKSLEKADVDLSELVSEVIKTLEEQEPERLVRVNIEPGITARCDERLTRIALGNLIGNAWKFTSRTDNAEIAFGELPGERRRTYFIRDNGAGFDMTYSDNLFKPFKRLHAASDFPGTGIGLATVERIIGLHGGKIWAESYPGEGATFYFCFGRTDSKRAGETIGADPAPDAPHEVTVGDRVVPLRAGKRG
jgi:signal transduction histidine kinase